MHIRPNSPAFLVLILSLWFSFSTGYALAQAEPEAERINSFLNYSPDPAHYPKPLHPSIRCLQEARTAKRENPERKADKEFKTCILRAEELLKTVNRGFQDELYLLIGLNYDGLEDSKSALSAYEKSLQRYSNNPLPLFRHAHNLRKTDRCIEAVREYNEVRWRTSLHEHELLYELAQCFLKLEKSDQAVRALEAAHSANPFFTQSGQLLVKTRLTMIEQELDPALREKMEKETIGFLQLIVQQNPTDNDSAKLLTEILIRQSDPLLDSGQLFQAESIAQRLSDASAYKDAEAVRLLFNAQLKQKKMDAASATLERGLKETPKSKILLSAEKQFEIEKQAREKNGSEGGKTTL